MLWRSSWFSRVFFLSAGVAVSAAFLVSDPARVFVHPLGRKTVAYHLLRLLILNPRTPYDFAFEDARIRDGLFERFVDFRLNECRKEVQ